MSEVREGSGESVPTRERNLAPGEAVLIRIEGAGGRNASFSIIGVRDKDGRATYMPIFGDLVGEDGEPKSTLNQFGVRTFVDRSSITEVERQELIRSLKLMPPMLAVDRVFNHTVNGRDSLSDYSEPIFEGAMPPQMVAVVAPPRAGKTTYLVHLLMGHYQTNWPDVNFGVIDMDPFSPEGLDEILTWVDKNVDDKGRNILNLQDEILKGYQALRQARGGQPKREVTLREMLNKARDKYRLDKVTHQVEGEVLKQKVWLVDLPGVDVDDKYRVIEKRQLDIFDLVSLSMASVNYPKIGNDDMSFADVLMFNVYMERFLGRRLEEFQRSLDQMMMDLCRYVPPSEEELMAMFLLTMASGEVAYLDLDDLEAMGNKKDTK